VLYTEVVSATVHRTPSGRVFRDRAGYRERTRRAIASVRTWRVAPFGV